MNEHKQEIVTRLGTFQRAISRLTESPTKSAMQTEFDALVQALADANSAGPLRRGIELPAAE
jgi:hypothetical protein